MKKLQNTYEVSEEPLTPDQLRLALSDFNYFTEKCQQIVNKERKMVPFKLNRFQQLLFETLLPMVERKTRLDRKHNVVLLKPRQVGASVSVIAFINYICGFVDGIENTSIVHVLPVADTISKLYTKKVEPIITGVHPDIMPNMERETMGSSILTAYRDIQGIKRNNFYELVSAGASSIRSDTIHVALFDEVAFYSNPEIVADAVNGALPDYGFSLAVYLSTFEDRKNDYFREKIITAMENPEDWTLIFAPWFITYPEKPRGIDYEDLELTDYDVDVIIPAMQEYGMPPETWGDAIDWYHTRSRAIQNMAKEFPTTLDEVLALGQDASVFSKEEIDKIESEAVKGSHYKLVTDTLTKKVEAHPVEDSPFTIYRKPIYGEKYRLVVDPIMAVSEDSDYFAMSMFNVRNNEQVATFYDKNLPIEDYADYAIAMCKLYNNAEICPESNAAGAFTALVNSSRYYRWYYESTKAKASKTPGIRTTATNKIDMIDKLTMMLRNGSIKINDPETIQEMRDFVKVTKKRSGGGSSVLMRAKKGKKDDMIATLWIYAGSLNDRQLTGIKRSGWAIL